MIYRRSREVIAEVGYVEGRFEARSCSILTSLVELPMAFRQPMPANPDEATIEACLAHDQANVFGYACHARTHALADQSHRIARALERARAALPWLSPDGKTQVSVEYVDSRPARIHSIAVTGAAAADAPDREIEHCLRAVGADAFHDDDMKPDCGQLFRPR